METGLKHRVMVSHYDVIREVKLSQLKRSFDPHSSHDPIDPTFWLLEAT